MIAPVKFFKDVIAEMQKVVWPQPKTIAVHTGVVIASMIIIILLMGGVDSLLVLIIQKTILKG